jgi:hypothetical protein
MNWHVKFLIRFVAMPRIEFLSLRVLLSLLIFSGLAGCGDAVDQNKGLKVKPTMRVTGKVLVDGAAPEIPVVVKAYPEGGATQDQAPSSGGTGADGVFELSTYNQGDGLPAGDYKLTFVCTELKLGGAALGGAPLDKLGGQYANPKTTPFSVTVKESKDKESKDVVDLGVFQLKKSSTPKQLWDDRSATPEGENKTGDGWNSNLKGGKKKRNRADD